MGSRHSKSSCKRLFPLNPGNAKCNKMTFAKEKLKGGEKIVCVVFSIECSFGSLTHPRRRESMILISQNCDFSALQMLQHAGLKSIEKSVVVRDH